MTEAEVTQLALRHLRAQGLWDWTFSFNKRSTSLGLCDYNKKEIQFSQLFLPFLNRAFVEDTILHEVAHALTPGARHGYKWRRVAKSLGAIPERTALLPTEIISAVRASKAKHRITCPTCGITHFFSRKLKHPLRFYRCSACSSKLG